MLSSPKTRGKPKKLKTFNELPQKYNRRLAISIAKKEANTNTNSCFLQKINKF
jgi:hypothetical protein